jgi:ATP-dependent Clp protease protease subunit
MDWLKIVNKAETNEVTIDIDGEIGGNWFNEGVTADSVKRDLQGMSDQLAQAVNKIVVNILNSPGGSMLHGFAIYDMLVNHKAEVETNGVGAVASIATAILQAGDEGKRNLSQNAMFLVHDPWGVSVGTAEQMESDAKDVRTFKSNLVNIYKETTHNAEDKIIGHMGKNNGEGEWWTAQQAIDNGYADSITKSYRIAASIDKDVQSRLKLPKLPVNQNQTINNMKKFIMSKFPSLAKVLNLKPEDEVEITAEHLESVNNSITEKEAEIVRINGELATEKQAKEKAEADLTAANNAKKLAEDKVAALQADLDKAKGKATETEHKDDPPLVDAPKTGNKAAADKDAENLKNR